MTNHHKARSKPWSDEDAQTLWAMSQAGKSHAEIMVGLGRTISSIEGKLRLMREALARYGELRGPETMRYETPTAIESDERKHLEPIIAAGGFSWLRPAVAERFYQLESAPSQQGRPFWRAS